MPSKRCLSVISVLSVLSVTLVYFGQTAGWIKCHLVRKGAQQPPPTLRTMSIMAKRSPISATAELLLYSLTFYCNVYCADERDSVRLVVEKCLLDGRGVQLDRCYQDSRTARILEANRRHTSQLAAGYRCRPHTCVS